MFNKISLQNLSKKKIVLIIGSFLSIIGIVYLIFYFNTQLNSLSENNRVLNAQFENTKKTLDKNLTELNSLKNRDEYKINQALEDEIKNIQINYSSAASVYENLLKLKELNPKIKGVDEFFTKALSQLSKRNYSSASATLTSLKAKITEEQNKLASSFTIPANVQQINTAPGAGYRRQSVNTEFGTFMVDVIAADLNSTRVIVDTASDGTCGNDCPVASLATFAGRSGAFAAINGPYFCPASYPSCQGKTNAFDTLLMNKNKVYFNSDNNVYSGVPAVIFSGGSARYVGASREWGRDTGVDAVIANQPLLVIGGNVSFGGDDDAKKSSVGSRSFIGSIGSTVYIGVVHGANVAQAARVLKAMGIENALNLDSGGSTALWSSGHYIVGPGRDTPFGILLVRK